LPFGTDDENMQMLICKKITKICGIFFCNVNLHYCLIFPFSPCIFPPYNQQGGLGGPWQHMELPVRSEANPQLQNKFSMQCGL